METLRLVTYENKIPRIQDNYFTWNREVDIQENCTQNLRNRYADNINHHLEYLDYKKKKTS